METWVEIENFPNYEVSDFGNVRNNNTGQELKPRPIVKNEGKYTCYDVCLYNGTRSLGFHHKIHRLVAKAFIPNPDNKPDIDHIDGDTSNNKITNLQWATASENALNQNNKIRSDNTSGHRNIFFCSQKQKWALNFQENGKSTHCGFYDTKEQATTAKETGNYNLLTTSTGEKHITQDGNRFVFEKTTKGKKFRKSFNTLPKAVAARDALLATYSES